MGMELQDIFLIAVSSIGFISVIKHTFDVAKWVWIIFLRPSKHLKEYGKWAIVTGSTDGIGKAMALELASKGLNIVSVGRNPSKLEATKTEIQSRCGHKVDVKNIVIDLAKCSGEEILSLIKDGIKGLDVGILVNNAGAAYPYARYFHEVDSELMESILRVNAEAATWVAKSVLPSMLEKRKGAIINIGSASSVALPSYPLYTVYAATKAYLAMFSRCIGIEYKHHGIDIQCQIPMLVATNMTRLKYSNNCLVVSPEKYAKSSIRWIGYEQLCSPVWSHHVQWFILNALPHSLLNWSTFRYFGGMRKRGLARDAKKLKYSTHVISY